MTSDVLHEWLTRLAAEAGADVDAAHERMSQAVTALVMCGAVEFRAPYAPALTLAPPVLSRCCDYGGECSCDDDDAPTRAELEAADGEEYSREASRMAWRQW